MTEKNRWQAVFASLTLTLALLGCEDSITGIPEPVAEATYAVEAVQAAALLGDGPCVLPPAGLISWWPGDGTHDDLNGANPVVRQNVTIPPGVEEFVFVGMNQQMEIDGSESLRLPTFTIDLWAERSGARKKCCRSCHLGIALN